MKSSTRAAALAAVLTAATMPSWAGLNTWTSLGPSGGEIRKVAYHRTAPQILYLTARPGFYRSSDGGASWQQIAEASLGAPQDFEIDPADPNRVYVAAGEGYSLWMSTDAGSTFNQLTTPSPGGGGPWRIEISGDGRILYASQRVEVLRSTDRGATWAKRATLTPSTSADVSELLVDPANSDALYALVNIEGTQHLMYSDDGGASWVTTTSSGGSAQSQRIQQLGVSPHDPTVLWAARLDGLVRSVDQGGSWIKVVAFPGQSARAIAFDPASDDILYVSDQLGRIYRSADKGATWTDISANLALGTVGALALHPTDAQQILAGGPGGLARTSNGGTSWMRRDAGVYATPIANLSVDTSARRVYAATWESGIHYLDSGAAAFTPVDNDALQRLAVLPNALSTSIMYVQPGTSGRLLARIANAVVRSADGGQSWEALDFPAPNYVGAFSSSRPHPESILAGTLEGLFRSSDGGDSWTRVTSGLPSGAFAQWVAVAEFDPAIAYAAPATLPSGPGMATAHGIYRSADGGLTWSPTSSGLGTGWVYALAVDPDDSDIVYVSTEPQLYKSVNGGGSWIALPMPGQPPSEIVIDRSDTRVVYAVTTVATYRSVDGGSSWEELGTVNFSWQPDALAIDPARPHTLIRGTAGFGAQELTLAQDLAVGLNLPAQPAPPAAPSTYTYSVTNHGPLHATRVRVSVQLPNSARDVQVTTSSGGCSVVGGAATCDIPVVRNRSTATVTVQATPPIAGAFELIATVASDQVDPSPANNRLVTNVSVGAGPSISTPASVGGGGGGGRLPALALALLGALATLRMARRSPASHA